MPVPPPCCRAARAAAVAALALLAVGAAVLAGLAASTEADIARHRDRVIAQARRAAPAPVPDPAAAAPAPSPHPAHPVTSALLPASAGAPPQPMAAQAALAALPPPVQRYLAFAFRGAAPPRFSHVELAMAGRFRRPRSEVFTPTRAEQTIAVRTPALVFAATTPLHPALPMLTARAYDAYADGQMAMKAKLLAAIPVLDEAASPTLNQISLRRWLLESPLYPMALWPGGPVRWEALDAQRARAVVTLNGQSASLVATFADDDGRLLRFDAETDGDLDTPYHGSGEHVTRDGYAPVDGMMIPMRFVIARAAAGRLLPFWEGRVTRIRFVAGP